MIRFIHAADAHIDSPLKGLEAHDGAPVDVLRGATRRAFENLIHLSIEENVAFLLLSGDIYDGDWKDYSTGLFFRRQMARLNDRGISVYLIAGNHDAASVISRKLTFPDNVHVFSTRTVESMSVPGHPVVIHGRGFPNRAVPENLSVDYPVAVPGKFNIGMLHTSLTGRSGHDTYSPCTEADLCQKGYDYWALGHVHQPEVIRREPWIVYAGSCQGRDVRETGPHGCRLVLVNDSLEVVDADWRDLDVVRWQVLPIDLTGVETESNALERASHVVGGAVLDASGRMVAARIIFTGATSLHGPLHRDFHRWQAELLARAQDHGPDAVWIESVRISTTPVYDLAHLAERDGLTRIVLDTLNQSRIQSDRFPMEIKDMLAVLPAELKTDVESDWSDGEGSGILNEVRAIILDALGTRGGRHAI